MDWAQQCTKSHKFQITAVEGAERKFENGLTIAIEPMINLGTERVVQMDDQWTIVTADGLVSAHYEHDVAVVNGKPEVLSTFKYVEEALSKKTMTTRKPLATLPDGAHPLFCLLVGDINEWIVHLSISIKSFHLFNCRVPIYMVALQKRASNFPFFIYGINGSSITTLLSGKWFYLSIRLQSFAKIPVMVWFQFFDAAGLVAIVLGI